MGGGGSSKLPAWEGLSSAGERGRGSAVVVSTPSWLSKPVPRLGSALRPAQAQCSQEKPLLGQL